MYRSSFTAVRLGRKRMTRLVNGPGIAVDPRS
jgi:hypothetical protein